MATFPTIGDDQLHGTPGPDIIDGGLGNDTIWGHGGTDFLYGNSGHDTLYGGASYDRLRGENGNDLLVPGFDGNAYSDGQMYEEVDGGSGTDTLDVSDWGFGVHLELWSAWGNSNTFWEVKGIENVVGSAHGDYFEGTDGANMLSGMGGSDNLRGYGGADTLYGGGGNDVLYGGTGADQQWGGSGSDVFVYFNVGESGAGAANRDVIHDFQDLAFVPNGGSIPGVVRDVFHLSSIDANDLVGGNQSFQLVSGAFTAAGQVRVRVEGGNTYVEANTDDYGSTAELQIQLDGVHNLTESNFIL